MDLEELVNEYNKINSDLLHGACYLGDIDSRDMCVIFNLTKNLIDNYNIDKDISKLIEQDLRNMYYLGQIINKK